jgi:hypothetical protein
VAKIGRNDRCPCGSGKKYKRCCVSPANQQTAARKMSDVELSAGLADSMNRMNAAEIIRKQQQGLGKPIISTEFKGNLMIAVGNRVYAVPKGKTFPDFLVGYLPSIMGQEWFLTELKATKNRHPIIEWHVSFCEHQKKHSSLSEKISSMPETGLTVCYLGLAYSLYLLQHNVELQERFISRLKDRNNFQGAYYELILANSFIRCGFDLALEDETDDEQKHCEFSATSKSTGKKYWIEAKARAVEGVLCKTKQNGTPSKDATSSLSVHISKAFKKPAADERLIFADVNDPSNSLETPEWVDRAERKLRAKEYNRKSEEIAYVFVTNMNFHHHLNSGVRQHGIMAYGFGMPDFAKAGEYTFREAYYLKKKHKDAHEIMTALRDYPKLPSTVDGSLPSETFASNPQHVKIGQTYDFDNIGVATVTTATVSEQEETVYFGTSTGHILTRKLNAAELADYKRHSDTFFGVVHHQGRKTDTPYEFFEHMVEIHLRYSEETILDKIAHFPDAKELRKLSHEERVLVYCERLAGSLNNRKKP